MTIMEKKKQDNFSMLKSGGDYITVAVSVFLFVVVDCKSYPKHFWSNSKGNVSRNSVAL